MNDYLELRRKLHQNPELSFKEFKTQQILLDYINKYKDEHVIIKTYRTNIFVYITGLNSKKLLAYRTDIDALKIYEETDLDYKSLNEGYMHACGHDIHMAVACGLYRRLVENKIDNDVLIIFQAGEEEGSGAKELLDIILGEYDINEIIALHTFPKLNVGEISGRLGYFFVGTREIDIEIKGKSSHIGQYHEGDDILLLTMNLLNQLHLIPYRSLSYESHSIVHFGIINGGSIRNALVDKIVLKGTIRSLSMLDELIHKIDEVCRSFEELYNIDINIKYGAHYPSLKNSENILIFKNYINNETSYKYKESDVLMLGEDFSYYLSEFKGFMFLLGVGNTTGLHTSTYNPDESAIEVGIDIVYNYFKK